MRRILTILALVALMAVSATPAAYADDYSGSSAKDFGEVPDVVYEPPPDLQGLYDYLDRFGT